MNYPLEMLGNRSIRIGEAEVPKLRTVLDEIDQTATRSVEELSQEEEAFVNTLKKNTTTPDVRLRRCRYIVNQLVETLGR